MKLSLTGLKAWIVILIIIALIILFLIFFSGLLLLLIPLVILLAFLGWLLSLFKSSRKSKIFDGKNKKKDYIDVEFKVK